MLTFKFIRTQDIRRMSNCDRTRRSEDFCYEYSDFGVWYTLRIIHRNLNPVLFEHLMKCLLKSEDAKSLKYSYSEKLELTDEDHSPQDSSELA